MNFSYSRRHFSWLPQAIPKILINHLSHTFGCAYMTIDRVINVFIPNEVRGNLHICYHWIITIGKLCFCFGFSNASQVDSLDRFGKAVIEEFKLGVYHLFKYKHYKKNKTKIENSNEWIHNMGLGDPKTCVFLFIFDQYDKNDTNNHTLFCYAWTRIMH